MRDEQAGSRMTQGMEGIFRLPLYGNSIGELQRNPAGAPYGEVALDFTAFAREYQLASRAHRAPLGQGIHHDGGEGISRLPALLFGLPILPQLSARCRTWIIAPARSTSHQRSPRNSLTRIPVKMAVTISGAIGQGPCP